MYKKKIRCIFLNEKDFVAGKIKRICETKLGIVSQCCKPANLIRLSKLYFENVALKINVKVCYSAHLSLVLFFFFSFFCLYNLKSIEIIFG